MWDSRDEADVWSRNRLRLGGERLQQDMRYSYFLLKKRLRDHYMQKTVNLFHIF